MTVRHDNPNMNRPKTNRPAAALVFIAWLSATAAVAQAPPAPAPASQAQPPAAQTPPTPVAPVTVEATSRKALEKQTRQFVDVYAQPTRKLGLLARWNDEAACIAVTGLVPEQGDEFKTRIEAVAKSVKAPLAPPKCKPNIEIAFTSQPQKYVDAAAAKNPAILGDRAAKAVTRPIQAWYATQDSGVAPRVEGRLDDPVPPAKGEPGYVEMARIVKRQREQGSRRCVDPGVAAHNNRMETADFSPTPSEVGTARLVGDIPCPHSLFLNVLIVVDVGHMGDVPVDLTSDYLALLALSQPKPQSLDGCLALPSVLDLYAVNCPGREPPTGLTAADRAYLAGLYAANVAEEQLGQGAQSEIAGRMVKIIDTPPKAAR